MSRPLWARHRDRHRRHDGQRPAPSNSTRSKCAEASRARCSAVKSEFFTRPPELALHAEIARTLSMPVFFCDPHSPWQRPTNENTNGLLRQYFPKGSDLYVHSQQRLAAVATELNDRPRKTLGWETPAARLAAYLPGRPR